MPDFSLTDLVHRVVPPSGVDVRVRSYGVENGLTVWVEKPTRGRRVRFLDKNLDQLKKLGIIVHTFFTE